jgi:ubiquinone/menaquinone biosynthesis C-methylase UbiE
MADASEPYYADARLAAIYDASNPYGEDYDRYYVRMAEKLPVPSRILDMGCGTGRLAVEIASLGHHVTGVDPAPGMIGVARSRPGHESVRWVDGDAETFSLEDRFDLIIMTGHAFQILQTEDAIRTALANLWLHLAPGGCVAFESRTPEAREWDQWTPELSQQSIDVPGVGQVQIHNSIAREEMPFVIYNTHFRFPEGTERIEPATLRFSSKDDIGRLLHEAGFTRIDVRGGWNGEAWTPQCLEIVVIAS